MLHDAAHFRLFYRKKNKVAHKPEFSAQLDRLLERIHINIFQSLLGLLAPDGVIVHLTDTLLLQRISATGYTSPATVKTLELTGGNLRENLDLIYGHLPEMAQQGLCLPGAFVHVHPQIMRLYKVELRFSLLWEFVHDEYEDRDYFVSAHVLTKL